jgi:hypothetical protein
MKNIDKNVFGSKKLQKQIAKKCKICGEPRYELLDTHRINEGKEYSVSNTCIICNRCHRLHHTEVIKIEGWCESTGGRLLHWFNEAGEEHFS